MKTYTYADIAHTMVGQYRDQTGTQYVKLADVEALVSALRYARDVINTVSEKAHGKADRVYCMSILREGNSIDAALEGTAAMQAAPAACRWQKGKCDCTNAQAMRCELPWEGLDAYALADALYDAGFRDCQKERDYDARKGDAWQAVVDAITTVQEGGDV